jgi:hypothetical protein
MPKVIKVDNELGSPFPLRVYRRKKHMKKNPSLRVKCGDCEQSIVIFYSDEPTGDPHIDTLEINGVMGSISQWNKLFKLMTEPQKLHEAP